MSVSDLTGSMIAAARRYVANAEGYQRFLYRVGALLLASAVFHTIVLVVTDGAWTGDVSWRKPIVFGESFGLTCWSLAWIMTFLPKRRRRGWTLASMLGVAAIGETALITMQQWRGVPSHFNASTPFNDVVFALMGTLIALAEIVILVMAVRVLFPLRAPRSIALAIRAGMLMLLGAQVLGNLIILNGSNQFGAAGAMKIPHALTLHAVQILPALAFLLLFTRWSEGRRSAVVSVAAAGYTGLVAVFTWQTFHGLAPLDLASGPAGLLGIGAALLAGAFAVAFIGLAGGCSTVVVVKAE